MITALALATELTWLLYGKPFQHNSLNYVKALMNARKFTEDAYIPALD